jgi:hypothetical protein
MWDDPSIGKRYSEEEMREILSLALQHDQVIRASVSQSELESVAAEIGISSKALHAALAAHESRKVPVAPIDPLPGLAWRSTALGGLIGLVSQAPLMLGESQIMMLLSPVGGVVTLMLSGAAASHRSRVGARLGFLRFQARNLALWLGFGGASWFIHAALLSAPVDSVRSIMVSAMLWALSSVAGGTFAAFRSRAGADMGTGSASPALSLVRRAARRVATWLSRSSARSATRRTMRATA